MDPAAGAKRIAEALKPFDVAWLEEPIRFNELDALAELARATAIPVAASERLATAPGVHAADRPARSVDHHDRPRLVRRHFARRARSRRSAEAAELPVTLHDCTGPIVYAASCALSATLPQCQLPGDGPRLLQRLVPRDRRHAADGRRTATSHRSKALGSGWRCGPSSSNGQTRRSAPRALEERQSR